MSNESQENQKVMSKLNMYVMFYESTVDLRKETMNRLRNWLRDTIPKEEWPGKDFSDENVKINENLDADIRNVVSQSLYPMEEKFHKKMEAEVKKHQLWPWLKSVRGVSTNLGSKLLHRLPDDIPAPSNLWSYAGLDGPGWRKRPHNWELTSICYLIGDQFNRLRNNPNSKYGKILAERKEYEKTKPWCGKCRPKSENDKIENFKY